MMDFLPVSKKGLKPPRFEKVPKHVAIVMDGMGAGQISEDLNE